MIDLAIIGGGLSGGLLAMALKSRHPGIQVRVFEKSDTLFGNHTWCLHDQDIPDSARSWFLPLLSKSWTGYDVHFPKYSRALTGKYHSIKSEELREKAQRKLGPVVHLGHELTQIQTKADGSLELYFANQTSLQAKSVVYADGWKNALSPKQLGWQKFVGLELEMKEPHGLSRPILKDVLQKQTDGYRFIYSLPFSETTLLIEDTYYSNSKELNVENLKKGILQYAENKGWKVARVLRQEVGQLPLFLDSPGLVESPFPQIGAGSQFVNPVTGYTLPMTLQTVEAIVNQYDFSVPGIKKVIQKVEGDFRRRLKYLIKLNRMMFLAAEPEKRFEILQRFYQLSEGLIGRFYSAQLTFFDRVRILSGKPPVPVGRAIKALTQDLTK